MFRPIVALTLSLIVFPAASVELSLLEDLEASRDYDYCTWAYQRKGDPTLLPDVAVYLTDDSESRSQTSLPSAIVIDAGMRVAKASLDEETCRRTFIAGRTLVASVRKSSAKGMRKQARFKKSKDEAIATIQAQIAALWMEDQLARIAYVKTQTDSKTDAVHWAHRISTADTVVVDEKSAKYMKEVLSQYDWIDSHRFSLPISKHAWILIQHSDDDVDLQKLALARMESHLETGGVLKRNYAYLWDRVAVNTGKLQRYGTQPDWDSCNNGMLTLMPMEDLDRVDEHRATMNLGPVQNDLEQMSIHTCRTHATD